jgi:hypothetical protein
MGTPLAANDELPLLREEHIGSSFLTAAFTLSRARRVLKKDLTEQDLLQLLWNSDASPQAKWNLVDMSLLPRAGITRPPRVYAKRHVCTKRDNSFPAPIRPISNCVD